MNKELEAKNLVQFRLTGTPDGNLLVSFYQLDVFNTLSTGILPGCWWKIS